MKREFSMRFISFKPLNAFTLVFLLTPTFSYGKLPDATAGARGNSRVQVANTGTNNFLRELFRCRDQMSGTVFSDDGSKVDFLNKCMGPYAVKTAGNSLEDCSARLLRLADAKGLAEVDINLTLRYISRCRKSNTLKIPPAVQPAEGTVEL
jgi:hypothetical protein